MTKRLTKLTAFTLRLLQTVISFTILRELTEKVSTSLHYTEDNPLFHLNVYMYSGSCESRPYYWTQQEMCIVPCIHSCSHEGITIKGNERI